MKRMIKGLFSFTLCLSMVLSLMPTTSFAADEADEVCILTAQDRESLNVAFNAIHDEKSEYYNYNKYVIQISPSSQQGGVLDAEGDTFEITRAGVDVSIEATRQDASDGDVCKTIKNATFAITLKTGITSTLRIGCNTTNDCKLIMDGGGYENNNPDVRRSMLKAFGKVEMYLGPNVVLQNNASADRAGCLLIDGNPQDKARSKVYLNGATIQNCSTTMKDLSGGAVFINCGSLKMDSGTITSCTGEYAAIHVSGGYGKFEMHGGSITNCSSTRGEGGAIFMNANMTSDLFIDGGIITGNTAGSDTGMGGGIFVYLGCYRISGDAKIYGNTAKGAGDDIYLNSTEFPEQSYIKDISYNDSFENQWFYDNQNDRCSTASLTSEYTYVANTKLIYTGLKAVAQSTVTYEYNKPVPVGASTTLPAASKKVCGSTVDVENAPDVKGYTFNGWETSDVTVTEGKFIMPYENVTFVGAFSPITYNITYDLDGGTVSKENPDTYNVSSEDITLNNPEKTGYTFAGWTGTDITTPQQTVTIPAGSIGEREYTANWTENTVDLEEEDNPPKPADPTSPKTGDNSHLFLWIALLFISGGAFFGTVVYRKKYRSVD